MYALPPEIWKEVFSHLLIVSYAVNSEAETWLRIATSDELRWDSDAILKQNLRTKWALSLVSKGFRELSRPILMECIVLRSVDQIESLARALREDRSLARIVERGTKRLDVILDGNPNSTGVHASDPSSSLSKRHQCSLADLRFILKRCHAVTSLAFRTDGRCVELYTDFLTACSETYSSLEVFRLNYIHKDSMYRILPFLTGLRILDLSSAKRTIDPWQQREALPIHELPHLHTLIGAFEVVCTYFYDSELPALRTLVLTEVSMTRYDLFVVLAPSFFTNHGEKITHLGVEDAELCDGRLLTLFPNVTDLVLQSYTVGFFKKGTRNVRTLGIIGDSYEEQIPVLKTVCTHREKGSYPELRTVRFLHPGAASRLRSSTDMVYAERLRTWSISIDDDAGNLVFPISY